MSVSEASAVMDGMELPPRAAATHNAREYGWLVVVPPVDTGRLESEALEILRAGFPPFSTNMGKESLRVDKPRFHSHLCAPFKDFLTPFGP